MFIMAIYTISVAYSIWFVGLFDKYSKINTTLLKVGQQFGCGQLNESYINQNLNTKKINLML